MKKKVKNNQNNKKIIKNKLFFTKINYFLIKNNIFLKNKQKNQSSFLINFFK